ncbi:MAG: ferredoxin [Acidimicrobiia bacterium]|nr:ferredoxin [Acidimicrobiia bacterium]MDH5238257.1 ferredoxin [Acidimicrobiia bacterium]
MRISVDRSICTGHGRCYALAPLVFEPDDDGYCVVTRAEVEPDLAEQARVGALNCPEDAITVTD